MERPIRTKNNGQINIVFNQKRENSRKVKKELVPKHDLFQQIDKEMENLVGMENIREIMKEIYAWIYVNKQREALGLKNGNQVLHMLFKGNPGTGKTSVARIVGKLLHQLGTLSKGHLIEAERADLVGEYIGHTAQKTRDLVKKAMGGILFIDEAYSLGRGGEKDFGKEAIDTLVKHMEDKSKDFILILAGYSKEMDQFLLLNPGLQSRFPFIMEFPDYTVAELMEIGKIMYQEREYKLAKGAEYILQEHLNMVKYGGRSLHTFSNGRYIRNIVEKSIRKQAVRLLLEDTFEKQDLLTIEMEDIAIDEGSP